MKKTLANIGVLLFSTLIMLVIGEFVIRALFADDTVLFPRYHTDVQYGDYTLRRIRPDSDFWHKSVDGNWQFVTNNQGFRNYENFDYEKPSDTIRILSIGDSHTQGYEVQQDSTFSATIGKYLSREGINVEVLNAGVSGFSTAEELVFLENEGIKYNPDFVVLGFFRNDIEDNIKAGLFRVDETRNLTSASTRYIPGVKIQNFIYSLPGIKWLSENSYLYSMLFNKTWVYFKKARSSKKAGEVFEYAVNKQQDYSDYQIALTSSLLERMYRFCSDNGIKLVIIDIPVQKKNGTIASSFPEALAPVARRSSDALIDSTALLADYQQVTQLHVPHGHRHISAFTHTILGIAAAREIRDLMANPMPLSQESSSTMPTTP